MSPRQVQITDLPLKAVDPDSPIPLYHQIEADLRDLIRTGKLLPSDILPPEVELSRSYGVGRHTMRMALARLVADNLIARKAGRGTYVKPQPDRKRFYLDRSFTRQMADMGLQARSKVLDVTRSAFDAHLPEAQRGRDDRRYFRLARLRYGDDEPIGLQYSVILAALCPGLQSYDFNVQSLYDVLSGDYGLVITEITHTVTAVIAGLTRAKMLHIRAGDALLVVYTQAFLADHQLIEFTTSYYRADMYEFTTTHMMYPEMESGSG
jgi:GntR family transcriptional regulator